jgi:hypothetical protein
LNLHLAVLILQRGYHLVNELPGVFRVILKISFEKLNRAGYRAAMMTEKRRFPLELVAQSEDVPDLQSPEINLDPNAKLLLQQSPNTQPIAWKSLA